MRKILFFGLLASLAFQIPVSSSSREQSQSSHDHSGSHLLEIGQPKNHRKAEEAPTELRIVSYNIRWRGGDDLKKLAKLFKEDPEIGKASILGLQEVDRNRKRTGNANTAKYLADDLGMHYAWAAPPPASDKEEQTGVAILSTYALSDVRRIVLPHEGPGGRRRAAIGATVHIGTHKLRVYSVHAETRMDLKKKSDQLKAVLTDLGHFPKDMPAIVLGDFNTWEGGAVKQTKELFTAESFNTPFNDESTFLYKLVFVPIKFKLDWIWLRNLDVASHGMDRQIKLSDHWPLWTVFRLTPPNRAAAPSDNGKEERDQL